MNILPWQLRGHESARVAYVLVTRLPFDLSWRSPFIQIPTVTTPDNKVQGEAEVYMREGPHQIHIVVRRSC